jgi:hypothetical protein
LAVTLLGRAIQTFQAVIILAERGMMADARALVRSVMESAIALGGVARIPAFSDRLLAADDKHRLSLINSMLEDKLAIGELDSQQIEAAHLLKKEMAEKYGTEGPKSIKWDALAESVGVISLYNTVYRDMSGDGAHATVASLMRHVRTSGDKIESLIFGANDVDLPLTLKANVSSMLAALEFTSAVMESPEMQEIASDHLVRLRSMTAPANGTTAPAGADE